MPDGSRDDDRHQVTTVWALTQKELGGLIKRLLPALKREMERDQRLG